MTEAIEGVSTRTFWGMVSVVALIVAGLFVMVRESDVAIWRAHTSLIDSMNAHATSPIHPIGGERLANLVKVADQNVQAIRDMAKSQNETQRAVVRIEAAVVEIKGKIK